MPRKAKKIQVGNKPLVWGKQLNEMLDSTDLYQAQEYETLRHRLETQGYLFVRNVINEETTNNARCAMLRQAAEDGSVDTDDVSYEDARIAKEGRTYAESYCVDGITGTETNERDTIDVDAWMDLGPSDVMRNVYNGEDVQEFWKNLFGEEAMKPLVKQTFLRLMGRNQGTIEHADYYYFKKDTDVFSDQDGRDAMAAAAQYLKENAMWDASIFELKNEHIKQVDPLDLDEEDVLMCGICCRQFTPEMIDQKKLKRLRVGDFGVNGEWHCPSCALKPMAIYTTWISLSHARPSNSVLSVCPGTHRLTNWDMPKRHGQVPGDFNWKFPWVIPSEVHPGDVVIFNVKTVHAASKNTSRPPTFRVSFDTRIQLVPEEKEEMPIVTPTKRRRSSKLSRPSPHPGLPFVPDDESEESDEDVSAMGWSRKRVLRDSTNSRRGRVRRKRQRDITELEAGVENLRV